jgi:short-subunit dehydrogenase
MPCGAGPKTAVVTGAAGGIGSAVAQSLAADGFDMILIGRTLERLVHLAASIRQRESSLITSHSLDMADQAKVCEFANHIITNKRRIDVLVFCHGNYARGRLEDSTIDDLDRLYAANVRGPFLLTKLLLRPLREAKGQIVFINSTVGLKGSENLGQYAAMQHALKGLADTLRNEVNRDGVRVVSVFCGRTATPLQERIFAAEGRQYTPELLSQPEDVALAVSTALRLGTNSEITDIRIRPMRAAPAPPAPIAEICDEELSPRIGRPDRGA